MTKKISQIKNPLLLLLTAAIWGTAFVAQSVSMDYIGAFTFNAARSIIGAITLLPVIWFTNHLSTTNAIDKQSPSQNYDKKTLIIGGICCGIVLCMASNFQQIGIKYTTVGKAGFITACYIIIVPILGIFLKNKCSSFIWIAVILALIGLYMLCMTPGESFSIGKGEFLVLICSFLFAIHILVIDYFSPLVDGVKMSCIQFFVEGIISAVLALLFEHPSIEGMISAIVPILYTGIMSTGVAYTLQILGQRDMNPTVASLILSLESCISVISGWLILGQKLSTREILGCIIMFAAIILAQIPQKNK